MSAAENIIRIEENQSLGFGNHTLTVKTKAEDFSYQGDLFKVKTYHEITKLEKNGSFLYESVPGTSVSEFRETEEGVSFVVSASLDVQITLGLAEQTSYEVIVDGEVMGVVESNLAGKLSLSVETAAAEKVSVEVKKA